MSRNTRDKFAEYSWQVCGELIFRATPIKNHCFTCSKAVRLLFYSILVVPMYQSINALTINKTFQKYLPFGNIVCVFLPDLHSPRESEGFLDRNISVFICRRILKRINWNFLRKPFINMHAFDSSIICYLYIWKSLFTKGISCAMKAIITLGNNKTFWKFTKAVLCRVEIVILYNINTFWTCFV